MRPSPDGNLIRSRNAPSRPSSALSPARLLNSEASGRIVLMGAAALALVVANSPVSGAYFEAVHSYMLSLSVLHWVNDALKAVFFLMVGLEIKPEMLDGQLSTWPRRMLPGIAALGGMVVPALVYLALNGSPTGTLTAGQSRRLPILPLRSACCRCSGCGYPSRSRCS